MTEQEINYEAKWGILNKQELTISPEAMEEKLKSLFFFRSRTRIPLDTISRIRWGVTRTYVNGIRANTTYSIFVGTDSDYMDLAPSRKKQYEEIIERLWSAVGIRLLNQMLEGLRDGERYRFGSAVVDDYGVELERRHVFRENEREHCSWTELRIEDANGSFYIWKADDKTARVRLKYGEEDNVHVLAAAMRELWEDISPRMSDLIYRDE